MAQRIPFNHPFWPLTDRRQDHPIHSSVYDIESQKLKSRLLIEMRYLENRNHPSQAVEGTLTVYNTEIQVDVRIRVLYFALVAEGCYEETI